MSHHSVLSKSIKLPNGATVNIKYWADNKTVYVAGFDDNEKQVTAAVYSASVQMAEDFQPTFQQSLIDGLVSTIESDLLNNPELHFRQ